MDWNPAIVYGGNFIDDKKLKNGVKTILITYETPSKRRYVRSAISIFGRVVTGVQENTKIIAWMLEPEPFKG